MNIKGVFKDKRGIEGLPMRLIIIVVIAGVVLAAIITMIPKTKGHMEIDYWETDYGGTTTPGFLVKVSATGSEEVPGISFTARINITDTDGKAIDGAKVTITGAGGAGAGTTDGTGVANVIVDGCTLPANQDTVYLKVKVTKSGYYDEIDEEGLQLQRV